MPDSDALSLVELSIGILIVVAMLMRAWLGRLGALAIVGFILIGLRVRILDDRFGFVSEAGVHILEFLRSKGWSSVPGRRHFLAEAPTAPSLIWIMVAPGESRYTRPVAQTDRRTCRERAQKHGLKHPACAQRICRRRCMLEWRSEHRRPKMAVLERLMSDIAPAERSP